MIFDNSQTLFNCFSFVFIFIIIMGAGEIIIAPRFKMRNPLFISKNEYSVKSLCLITVYIVKFVHFKANYLLFLQKVLIKDTKSLEMERQDTGIIFMIRLLRYIILKDIDSPIIRVQTILLFLMGTKMSIWR